jgi:hypothetical protein
MTSLAPTTVTGPTTFPILPTAAISLTLCTLKIVSTEKGVSVVYVFETVVVLS